MPRLTKLSVESVPILDKPNVVWDDKIPGFAIKVLPSGARRYILKYRTKGNGGGKQRWLTLGTHGAITCDQARQLAQRAHLVIASGGDPQVDKEAEVVQLTLLDAWEKFETEHLPIKKPSTQSDYRGIWSNLVKPVLGPLTISEIDRSKVDSFHKSLSKTPYQANRALALLSRLFGLSESWSWRQPGSNPCRRIEKFPEQSRQRFLRTPEIGRLRATIRELVEQKAVSPEVGHALQLLLLTGARSSEITLAQWAWVDWDRSVLNLPDSKTGQKTIYLSTAAVEVLRSQEAQLRGGAFIFPGSDSDRPIVNLRKPWKRICKHAGLEGVRIHDLRHTAASVAIASGASLAIVGKLLGHTQAQTTLRYAHLDSDPALAAANLIGKAISETG